MSYHESGERHAVLRRCDRQESREEEKMRRESAVNLQPPATLRGAHPLFHTGVFPFQFLELLPVGTNLGQSIVLDTDAANFRDDFIVIKVQLVEPGAEDRIPIAQDTGPRILHLVKGTTPWLAVEVFQQSAP
jgi:hypothetical protein